VITVWGNDENIDDSIDGALEDELLTLKVWSKSTRDESAITIESIKNVLTNKYLENPLKYRRDELLFITVEIDKEQPGEYILHQNYPNPFNPVTTIGYGLKHDSYVLLDIYNILGQHIDTIVNEYQKAGFYEVLFDGSRLPSGTYFYRLNAGEFNKIKKFVLLK